MFIIKLILMVFKINVFYYILKLLINVLWHVAFYGTGGYESLYQVPQFDTLRIFYLVCLHSCINSLTLHRAYCKSVGEIMFLLN